MTLKEAKGRDEQHRNQPEQVAAPAPFKDPFKCPFCGETYEYGDPNHSHN